MAQLDFKGRVAIVTGAGRGMGRSHAVMLASRGARVVVNDISAEHGENPADAVARQIREAGGQAVANHDSVVTGADKIVQAAIDAFGQVDIVVNNAGVGQAVSFAEVDPQEWQRVFEIHYYGTVRVTRAAWPHLVRSGSGRVVNTASSAMLGNASQTSYGSAKGAIWSFTRSIAMEGEPHGITAHSILPSAKTRLTENVQHPVIAAALDKYFQPEHVSALVVWLAHQHTQVNNESWQVSGGRAGRLTMAAFPTVRVGESTPEMWASKASDLMADGPLAPLRTLAEMFGNELADADPDIRRMLSGGSGGFDFRPAEGGKGWAVGAPTTS